MAKNPTARPWDAEAVNVILNELRDKAARSQPVAMVWPSPDSAEANPRRAGVGALRRRARPKKKGKKSGDVAASGSWASAVLSRVSLETIGLVAALIAVGGLMVYWVWPPGAEYLYRHAVPLMESTRRSDRLTALEEFIDPLDQRFPNHPYKEQTQAWRDLIALDDAESRSKMLESTTPSPFSEPKTNGERHYVAFFSLASKAAAAGREDLAARYWREMADTLKADDPDDRKWILLSKKRADELESKIKERRAFVEEQLRRADAAFRGGRPNEAVTIHAMLNEKFGRYADLADLLAPVPPQSAPPAQSRRTPPQKPTGPRRLLSRPPKPSRRPRPRVRRGEAGCFPFRVFMIACAIGSKRVSRM